MEIHFTMCPSLHGRIGYLESNVNEEEVTVLLNPKNETIIDHELPFHSIVPRDKKEIVIVPKFCLCLQESILKSRLENCRNTIARSDCILSNLQTN
jgi:hypothetical protein